MWWNRMQRVDDLIVGDLPPDPDEIDAARESGIGFVPGFTHVILDVTKRWTRYYTPPVDDPVPG